MAKKTVRTAKKAVREVESTVIPAPDKDTNRWDGMTTEDLCQEALTLLKDMFKQTHIFVKLLAYIEQNGKWRDLDTYKERSFAYFVEDFFGIRPGTYYNMKAVAYRYGEENFNRWGVQDLKRVEGTTNPDATLAELNKLYDRIGKKPSGVKVREVIERSKPRRELDGVLTPWSVQRVELVNRIRELEKENMELRNSNETLRIKLEQAEDQMKR